MTLFYLETNEQVNQANNATLPIGSMLIQTAIKREAKFAMIGEYRALARLGLRLPAEKDHVETAAICQSGSDRTQICRTVQMSARDKTVCSPSSRIASAVSVPSSSRSSGP